MTQSLNQKIKSKGAKHQWQKKTNKKNNDFK